MNATAIIVSTLITVICVVFVLLQHYYIGYVGYYEKKITDIIFHEAVFEDMISIGDRNNYVLGPNDTSQMHELKVLNSLNEALKFHVGDNTESSKVVNRSLDFQLSAFKNIDEKRDILQNLQQRNPIYDAVRKRAYYLHVYHTVDTEGNTMSLEQVKYVLETGRAVEGKSVSKHNEILGIKLALQYIKLLTRFPTIEVQELLGIHQRVLGYVDPINSGTFRNKQVSIGNRVPSPPEDLPNLMRSYVGWLNSLKAQGMHPIRYATLAHYKLVDMRPFKEGNGRTSRLLMNLVMLKAGYPPVVILKDDREKYYKCLSLANQGDFEPLVSFIADCTERMIDVYIWSIERFSRSMDSVERR